jgi:hypothetical protein
MKLHFVWDSIYRFKMSDHSSFRFIFKGDLPEINSKYYKRIEEGYNDFEFQKGGQLERIESDDIIPIVLLNLG